MVVLLMRGFRRIWGLNTMFLNSLLWLNSAFIINTMVIQNIPNKPPIAMFTFLMEVFTNTQRLNSLSSWMFQIKMFRSFELVTWVSRAVYSIELEQKTR